jgi:hypothetical protein
MLTTEHPVSTVRTFRPQILRSRIGVDISDPLMARKSKNQCSHTRTSFRAWVGLGGITLNSIDWVLFAHRSIRFKFRTSTMRLIHTNYLLCYCVRARLAVRYTRLINTKSPVALSAGANKGRKSRADLLAEEVALRVVPY